MPRRPVLVLGATGGFGGALARELIRRGRPIRVFARQPDKAAARLGDAALCEFVQGDVADREGLIRAAQGCGAIVDGINYPFHKWLPRMVEANANLIAAARRSGATILFPGNVYGLGRQSGRSLPETAENRPSSRKGAIRVQLEQALKRAASPSGPRVIILRAGDYFGPTVRNGMVDRIFGNALRGRPMRILGRADIPHQWAYVPDLARAGVELVDMGERLAPFEVVHFRGYIAWPLEDFLRLVARQAGLPDLPFKTVPWPILYLLGALSPVEMELLEIRYLWKESVVIDDPRLRRLLPDFRPTAIEAAVGATVESYRAEHAGPPIPGT